MILRQVADHRAATGSGAVANPTPRAVGHAHNRMRQAHANQRRGQGPDAQRGMTRIRVPLLVRLFAEVLGGGDADEAGKGER